MHDPCAAVHGPAARPQPNPGPLRSHCSPATVCGGNDRWRQRAFTPPLPASTAPVCCRLVLWFLMALPAVREWYEYIEASEDAAAPPCKLGPFAWIAIATTCLETLASLKFGRGLYPRPCPWRVRAAWGVSAGVGAAVLLGWAWRHHCCQQPRGGAKGGEGSEAAVGGISSGDGAGQVAAAGSGAGAAASGGLPWGKRIQPG